MKILKIKEESERKIDEKETESKDQEYVAPRKRGIFWFLYSKENKQLIVCKLVRGQNKHT